MKILIAVLAILLALSVVGFVIKTLFWLGVVAAIAFVGFVVYGVAKDKLTGGSDGKAIR